MYETFEHIADIGVRGFGDTLEKSFVETAKAMFSIMFEIGEVESSEGVKVVCEADDEELLLVEWLNALLATADINEMAFGDFYVTIRGNQLEGIARGEKRNLEKHRPKLEVKAATYSSLGVYRENEMWVSQCVVHV
jgi:SHS2 domain-containing protein